MKVGLISDTHIPESRTSLWPQVLEAFSDVECILHAGDLHELSVIDTLNTVAPTYAARGNGEDGSAGRTIQPDHDRLQETWVLNLNGFKIGLTHYIPMPEMPPRLTVTNWIKKKFPETELDVLIYGDTHVEQIDVFGGVLCINPGSPTFPHNLNLQLGTIGILDLGGESPSAEIFQLTESGIQPFDWLNSRRPW
jgi:putative phosphoesterase